ncbi:MAG: UPF0262 family protein [Alphaproteobacteria bacterium]|nr:UPF0262 family protein [Alphaproteobacteria bacterium]MCB9975617.1 UPF0262 family protein [Rhodospirillales bacterium]
MKPTSKSRIRSFDLRGAEDLGATTLIVRDHQTAMHDLRQDSYFQPVKDHSGPYDVVLSIEENRLVFRVTNVIGDELPMLVLSLKPYQRLIKDYFMIVHSYEEALREGKPSRIEAIDMGRRGLHNEGAELLMDRLMDKILMDLNTSRRLFSLICVLHSGKALIWR